MSAPRAACHHLLEPVDPGGPFWRTVEAWRDDPHAFLLDSGTAAGDRGRFSLAGGEPLAVLRARRADGGAELELRRRSHRDAGTALPARGVRTRGDPYDALRRLLAEHPAPRADGGDAELPFLGGLIGYFGYGLAHCSERLPDTGLDDLGLADACFLLVDAVLVHDHRTGRTWLSVCGWADDERTARARARSRRDAVRARLESWRAARSSPAAPAKEAEAPSARGEAADLPVHSWFDQASYVSAVERIREHILDGRVFEVCLTHRLDAPLAGDPWDLYRELRRVNPAPFAAWLRLPEATVVCASPERFLKLDAARGAEARPIKGTRPRGATPAEDARLRRELAASEKDRAENVMIVDLLRNDLGRVCRPGSVTVPELCAVEEYATVFQLVSTIRGQLRPEHDGLDLVRACFPGGSMTGAPKIEAMKVIDELEPVTRGIYAGAIGYLDLRGGLDLNIVIRSLVCREGRAYLSVGGAVTADSDPAAEWRETLDKARAPLAALGALWRRRRTGGRNGS